ncbi:penicillin acylase family protein [Bradyrhizobium cenepequi]|uniref:penicillin acylase family protein n=1 Tax=Bradyrhizobium cenepequi TaxID=2821403 RepID=UPI001CE32DC6|nr:penicillin acylase family protein [Bradyrhizobium cenepequi]MCA6111334.1 penicillin acylase family protein [Bradyrhizobium cenepequi]
MVRGILPRWVVSVGAACVCLVAIAAAIGWMMLRASLPVLDGVVRGSGLSAKVTVDRDALGVPTIAGVDRGDLAYATGFVHAQDRFFQMDLLRRTAAGELAELFGSSALDLDRRHRLHQFRKRAAAVLAAASADDRRLVERYTRGVNDGLHALSVKPFEYLMLRITPSYWRPEDSILVIYSMYFELQYRELESTLARALMRERLPNDIFSFLVPDVSHWDAPLDEATSPTMEMPALPATNPDWQVPLAPSGVESGAIAGSNSWAVSGTHSRGSAGLIANDMHLGLRLPNIWYRLSLVYPDAHGTLRRVTGASLPGTPAIIVGSNGRVAWGFTNSSGNHLDLVTLDDDTIGSLRYHVLGGGSEEAVREVERISVKGGPAVDLPVVKTRWGPVTQLAKKTYAIHWIAHDQNAISLRFLRMEDADSAMAAIKVGQASGIPTQNLIAADASGHIGWTLAGPLPRRLTPTDGLPVSGRYDRTWSDYLTQDEYPAKLDPPLGRLWTANNRQLSDADQDKIGGKDADLGARASQIRDDLLASDSFDERSFLAIQLDDRALWTNFWRQLLLDTLDEAALADHSRRAELKLLVAEWNGRADADAVGYALVRSFYRSMYDAWFGGLDAELGRLYPTASYRLASGRTEAVMETLAAQHAWAPPEFTDWRAFVLDRIDTSIARMTRNGARLQDAQWGLTNRAAIAHPLARILSSLRLWLAVPPDPLPGDINMPRVQAPEFGASERMVVAAGHEETGIFEMPGGQSGHPLSPFFLAGHKAWVRGDPSPFLPGPAVHHLVFEP